MRYECDICHKKFDSPQKLGGHKTSHSRTAKQYDSRRGKTRTETQKANYRSGRRKMSKAQEQNRLRKYHEFRDREKEIAPYVVSGVKLDVSRKFVEDFRKSHTVCQICGKPERKTARNGSYKGKKIQNLCVDHEHGTNKFRGLLCNDCNKKLGWFENNKESVLKYLEDSPNG